MGSVERIVTSSMVTSLMSVTNLFPVMRPVVLSLRSARLSLVLLLVTRLQLILIKGVTSVTIAKTRIPIFVKLEVSTMRLAFSEMVDSQNLLLRQLSQFTRFQKISILNTFHWSNHFHALSMDGENCQMVERFSMAPKC